MIITLIIHTTEKIMSIDKDFILVVSVLAFFGVLMFTYVVITHLTATPVDRCADIANDLVGRNIEDPKTKQAVFVECLKTQTTNDTNE